MLAVGLPNAVHIYTRTRTLKISNRVQWAKIAVFPIVQPTSGPATSVVWIKDGALVVCCGQQMFVFGRWMKEALVKGPFFCCYCSAFCLPSNPVCRSRRRQRHPESVCCGHQSEQLLARLSPRSTCPVSLMGQIGTSTCDSRAPVPVSAYDGREPDPGGGAGCAVPRALQCASSAADPRK